MNCSLERLAQEIGYVYNEDPGRFELDDTIAKSIRYLIREGKYHFTPLILEPLSNTDPVHWSVLQSFQIRGFSGRYCLRPLVGDTLVLTALGRMINQTILESSVLIDQSFGFKIPIHSFFENLGECGEVSTLLYLNLTPTMISFPCSKEYVYSKLYPILKDRDVINLVWSFINIPIEFNNEIIRSGMFNIPPVGIISIVLFNFFLDDLDRTFISFLPDNAYYRYISKTFIMNYDIILIKKILSERRLNAKIHLLTPGSPPININSLGYSIRVCPGKRLLYKKTDQTSF
jgi:hypothetical protein